MSGIVITAGDSLNLLLSAPGYPAGDGWTLTLQFHSRDGSAISESSTPEGAGHLFNIAASTTAGWLPGTYFGTGQVSKGSERYTVWRGQIVVEPDLAQQPQGFDGRSHARKCLDAINAVLEGKATRDVISTSIAGQSITRMSFRELLEAKAYYESLVLSEGQTGKGNHILARFNAA